MDRTAEVSESGAIQPVVRIPFSVDWPPGHVAAYLIRGDEPILLDAGHPGDAARAELERGLAAEGLAIADIDHLVLTHGHPDHTGQVPAIRAEADPTVYAPAAITERVGRDLEDLRTAVRANTTAAGTAPDRRDTAVEWAVRDVEFCRDRLPIDAIDVRIDHGDTVSVGGVELDAVHTPGHNAEHLVYMATIGSERVAFSGDMAISLFRPVLMHVGLDDGVRGAVPAFERSLDRLDRQSVDLVYPGHGPVHDDFLAAVSQSRESLDRLLDATAAHLEDEVGDTAVAIARARLDEADSRSLGYMLPETVAALAHLERTGRVSADLDSDGVRRYDPAVDGAGSTHH